MTQVTVCTFMEQLPDTGFLQPVATEGIWPYFGIALAIVHSSVKVSGCNKYWHDIHITVQ